MAFEALRKLARLELKFMGCKGLRTLDACAKGLAAPSPIIRHARAQVDSEGAKALARHWRTTGLAGVHPSQNLFGNGAHPAADGGLSSRGRYLARP